MGYNPSDPTFPPPGLVNAVLPVQVTGDARHLLSPIETRQGVAYSAMAAIAGNFSGWGLIAQNPLQINWWTIYNLGGVGANASMIYRWGVIANPGLTIDPPPFSVNPAYPVRALRGFRVNAAALIPTLFAGDQPYVMAGTIITTTVQAVVQGPVYVPAGRVFFIEGSAVQQGQAAQVYFTEFEHAPPAQ